MSREFRLEDPGEGIHEAEVVEIACAEGDEVEEGDTVLAVETDKATTELPAPYSGTVERIHVQPGDQVEVGDLLITFSGEAEGAAEPPEGGAEAGPEAAAKGGATAVAQRRAGAPQERPEKAGKERPGEPSPGAEKAQHAEHEARPSREGPIPAAPSTRRLARELGVALQDVEPSGPAGRVLAEDVRRFAEGGADKREAAETEAASRRAPPAAAEGFELPDSAQWGETERVRYHSIRRATGMEMARAWAEIPHVMHHDLADITELERFRREQAERVEAQGGKLTLTVLVMKAAVAALKAYPYFNASLDLDDESIILKRYYHIGVAVATERGLLVPVIRDVDRKSVMELAVEVKEVAERVRQGEVQREEMLGGTFTLTNVGPIGGTLFTPIIRHPEAAILGLARAELQPVAQGDLEAATVATRLRLPLCLAFDHRINDGAAAAQLMNRVVETLQDPESLLLSV
jgi:pyruvate dehydrogenase E2 component (dihydrolipoamide acetyltransferase)